MFAKTPFVASLKKFSPPLMPIGPLYPRNMRNSNYPTSRELHAKFCPPNLDEKLEKNQLSRLWGRQRRAA